MVKTELVRIGIDDAEKLWKMQVKAFEDLYKKYQDTETSPATEKVEKIIMRLEQPFTYYYFIVVDVIKNWLRNRNTLEFLGTWEQIYNSDFKVVEFDHFKA